MEYKLYYKSFYSNIMENIDIGKEYKSFLFIFRNYHFILI